MKVSNVTSVLSIFLCICVFYSILSYESKIDTIETKIQELQSIDSIKTYKIDSLNSEIKEVEYFIKALHQKEASLSLNPKDGSNGDTGPLQIREICLREFNNGTGCNYKLNFIKHFAHASFVAKHELNKGCRIYYNKYGKLPTPEQIARMWNGGIYQGYLYPSTKYYAKDVVKYYKSYKRN